MTIGEPTVPFAGAITFLRQAITKGSCTEGFVAQICRCLETGLLDVDPIMDRLVRLEAVCGCDIALQGVKKFRNPPLRGFMYIHHIQARYIINNLKNEIPRIDVAEILRPHLGKTFTKEHAKMLAHEIVVNGYQRRAREGRLTGEWLIFERVNDRNYYLTLAEHDEGDGRIFDRIGAFKAAAAIDFNRN